MSQTKMGKTEWRHLADTKPPAPFFIFSPHSCLFQRSQERHCEVETSSPHTATPPFYEISHIIERVLRAPAGRRFYVEPGKQEVNCLCPVVTGWRPRADEYNSGQCCCSILAFLIHVYGIYPPFDPPQRYISEFREP